ncbi:MAG: hypothetical protein GYA51_07580 [Candidatus Methanofastidiosa archaeon]|jgi:hypothetical protein|nr:hypothetical protein [Candidatus Methanofastidiosa archaeon]
MRAKKVNEGIFDDPGNLKAISSYTDALYNQRNFRKTIQIDKPFTITLDRQKEAADLEFILNKYRIPFTVLADDKVTKK